MSKTKKKIVESKENSKSKKLVIDVVIPDHLIDESNIKNFYNKEESKLTYVIGDNYTDEFITELEDVTSELNNKQLLVFNPIISILKDLDSIKSLQPTGDEKKDENLFKEANKFIRSFNGTNKKAKDLLKRPIIDLGKKIQNVYNVLDEESVIAKNSLEENFKDLLEKKEKEKQEKIKKEKAEELARIEELNRQNEEANRKLRNQEKMTQKLTIESTLKDIFYNATKNLENISVEGLQKRLGVIQEMAFVEYFKRKDFDESLFDEAEMKGFASIYNDQIKQSENIINAKIVSLQKDRELEISKIKEETRKEVSNEVKPNEVKPAEVSKEKEAEITANDFNSDDELFTAAMNDLEDIAVVMRSSTIVLNTYDLKDETNHEFLEHLKKAFDSSHITEYINYLKSIKK